MTLPRRLPTLSVKETASALGVHPSTVYRWVTEREIEAIRYSKDRAESSKGRGGEIHIPEHAVVERLQRGSVRESQEAAA